MRTRLSKLAVVAIAILLGVATIASPARAGDFRVCADPDYLPFSNRAGEGFENKIAAYVAHALGERLVYTWANTRGPDGFEGFVRATLNKRLCDVVMDVPYASDDVLPSEPYYFSSYIFVFPKSKHYDIDSMDSPALKDLKIGFEQDTPAETGLKIRTLILHSVPFDSADDPTGSPRQMLDAIGKGKIAVGITWEPAVGYFLQRMPQLAVVGVPNARSQGSPEQYNFPMAMAARLGDHATQKQLDRVIAAHATELTAILAANGVKLYKPPSVAQL
jgi:mxaJ protein